VPPLLSWGGGWLFLNYGLKKRKCRAKYVPPPSIFVEKFSRVLVEQQQDRARREQERIRLFSADPFDLEAQAKIEEDIR
jgi:hypothetical protein